MLALPISLCVTGIILLLIIKGVFQRAPKILLAVLGVYAFQSFLVALRFYYGLNHLGFLLPITASMIPALTYWAFRHSIGTPPNYVAIIFHLIGPFCVVIARLFAPFLLDIFIPALFFLYGVAILVRLAKGEVVLSHTNLGAGGRPLFLWRLIAIMLIVSALCDGLIAANFVFAHGQFTLTILSTFSGILLVGVGYLLLQPDLFPTRSKAELPEIQSDQNALTEAEMTAILGRLRQNFAGQRLYLDPDLTLNKLARRLRIPAKKLSITINMLTGENTSRFVNRYRIEHACQLLEQGQTITQTYLDSGFHSKSNFYREFLRITGTNPASWPSASKAPPKGLPSKGG